MSMTTCLVCKEVIVDAASDVQIPEFGDTESVHSIHVGCLFCSECRSKLNVDDAFVTDGADKRLLCLEDLLSSLVPDCAVCNLACTEDFHIGNGLAFHRSCRKTEGAKEPSSLKNAEVNIGDSSDCTAVESFTGAAMDRKLTSKDEIFLESNSRPEPVQNFAAKLPQIFDPELFNDDPRLGDDSDVVVSRTRLPNIGPRSNQSLIQSAYKDSTTLVAAAEPDPLMLEDHRMTQHVVHPVQQGLDQLKQGGFQSHFPTEEAERLRPIVTSVFWGQLEDYLMTESRLLQQQQVVKQPSVHIGEFQLDQNGSFDATGMIGWHNRSYGSLLIPSFSPVGSAQSHPVYDLVETGGSCGFQLAVPSQDTSVSVSREKQNPSLASPSLAGLSGHQVIYATKSRPASPSLIQPGSSQRMIPANLKRRGYISPQVKAVLSEAFRMSMFPSKEARIKLGQKTGLDPRQVQVWFQNARRKWKMSEGSKAPKMCGVLNHSF